MFWCFTVCGKMQSDDEREMCSRTVYCTNIDKKVANQFFFFHHNNCLCHSHCISLKVAARETGCYVLHL